jgi:hypothetical protein
LKNQLSELQQIQRERIAHIDFTLLFKGEAVRADLTQRFNISPAQATKDLKLYGDLAPGNVEYIQAERIHTRASKFKALFEYDVTRTLSTISQGFGDGFSGKLRPPLACEAPHHLNQPELKIVATISEAIYKKTPVQIEYVSLSSGKSKRVLVPHTLVDNGLRWHVRAYDRKQNGFRDFVLTRVKNAVLLGKNESDYTVDIDSESSQWDKQWNRIVELELIPHPNINHAEAIEMDYGMANGYFTVEIRAAVTGYLLRLWNIDCTPKHTLTGSEFQLALHNPEALYGVENAQLAPGFNAGAG